VHFKHFWKVVFAVILYRIKWVLPIEVGGLGGQGCKQDITGQHLPSCQSTDGWVDCDETRPEMLKALNRGVFIWLVCVNWPGVLEGHRKFGKLG